MSKEMDNKDLILHKIASESCYQSSYDYAVYDISFTFNSEECSEDQDTFDYGYMDITSTNIGDNIH